MTPDDEAPVFWQQLEQELKIWWDQREHWENRCHAYKRAVRLAHEASESDLFRYMDRAGYYEARYRYIVACELSMRILAAEDLDRATEQSEGRARTLAPKVQR